MKETPGNSMPVTQISNPARHHRGSQRLVQQAHRRVIDYDDRPAAMIASPARP